MVDTEDIKVWKFEDGTYEQHYYLSNGVTQKCRISEQEFKKLLLVYGGGNGGKN